MRAMGLRICLVTPFAWSQPHDVNEHVAGIARELRALGRSVTVLASSNRARDLAAGRRALLDGLDAEVVVLGPAVPISRRSRIGVPVGARANLSLALALGRFDVVHGFEPGLPSLSYLALRDAQALAVATFLSPERLGCAMASTCAQPAPERPAHRFSPRRASSSPPSRDWNAFASRRLQQAAQSRLRPGPGNSRSWPAPRSRGWQRTPSSGSARPKE